MSICRFSSCLSAKEMGKSKQSKVKRKLIKNKVRGFSTERSSKPPSSDSADVIVLEIEVSQSCTLREDSCKALCPSIGDLIALPSPRRVFPTAHNKNLHPERWEHTIRQSFFSKLLHSYRGNFLKLKYILGEFSEELFFFICKDFAS